MDESAFWAIIQAGGPYPLDAQDSHLDAVRGRLLALTPEQVRAFHTIFCRRMIDAQSWDMWGAAYLINGGCSDDGFVYFRAWLIAQGRATYSAAVADSDGLAGAVEPGRDDHEFELFYALPRDVYEELTGEEMPKIEMEWPAEPGGERWDFDDNADAVRRILLGTFRDSGRFRVDVEALICDRSPQSLQTTPPPPINTRQRSRSFRAPARRATRPARRHARPLTARGGE